MKKVISFILLICFTVSLVACGSEKGLTEEQRQRYEEYALGTTGTYTFLSGQNIEGVFVIVPDDMTSFLKENIGDVSHLELGEAEALVVDLIGATFHAYIVSDKNTVLYKYAQDEAQVAPASGAPSSASSSESGSALSELRKAYARTAVELDQFDVRYASDSAVFATITALKNELGDSYFLDPRYIALETDDPSLSVRAEKYLQELYRSSLYIKQQEVLEKKTGEAMTNEEIELIYELNIAKRTLQKEINQTEQMRASVEEAALLVLSENNALINEIKAKTKEKNYMDDTLFYQLCEKSNELQTYANSLRLKDAQEKILKLYDELFTVPANVVTTTLDKYVALAENSSQQNICRTNLAKAIVAEQTYREVHAQAIADYETAAKAIQSRYSDSSYEEDIDYLKLNIVNEDLLNNLDTKSAAVKSAESALQGAIDAASRIEAEKTLEIENAVLENHKNAEVLLLNDFLQEQATSLIPDDEGNYDEDTALPGWQKMSEEFVEKMNAKRKIYIPPSPSTKSSGGSSKGSSGGSSSDPTFKEWLKDNDPESYEYYKDLEKGWDSLDD